MDVETLEAHMQYIERNGCTFNIEEGIQLGLALGELKSDLNLKKIYLMGKVTGKCLFMHSDLEFE